MTKKKIFIVGTGAGGHLIPALSLGEELLDKNRSIIYIVGRNWLNKELFREKGFFVRTISGAGFPRKINLNIFWSSIKFLCGFIHALFLILQDNPELVIGMGGYISLPVVLAARIFGKKVIIHEQNVHPGLANRLSSPLATVVAVSFSETKRFFPSSKVRITGNPLRREIGRISRAEGLAYFKLSQDKKTILVFGGSQGARSVNRIFFDSLQMLTPYWKSIQIIHLTGVHDFPEFRKRYKKEEVQVCLLPFLRRMEYAYGACDWVISRAGATTVAEILAAALPSVLIPYPHAAENHQYFNAHYMVRLGAAMMFEERDLTPELMADTIRFLLTHPEKLSSMKDKARSPYNGLDNLTVLIEKLLRTRK